MPRSENRTSSSTAFRWRQLLARPDVNIYITKQSVGGGDRQKECCGKNAEQSVKRYNGCRTIGRVGPHSSMTTCGLIDSHRHHKIHHGSLLRVPVYRFYWIPIDLFSRKKKKNLSLNEAEACLLSRREACCVESLGNFRIWFKAERSMYQIKATDSEWQQQVRTHTHSEWPTYRESVESKRRCRLPHWPGRVVVSTSSRPLLVMVAVGQREALGQSALRERLHVPK